MFKLELENFEIEKEVNPKRVTLLNSTAYKKGAVVYWMQRDQRACNNWALLYAQELALKYNEPLLVIVLENDLIHKTFRQRDFMFKGLMKLEKTLLEKNINLFISKNLEMFLKEHNAGYLVTDFNPLKTKLAQENKLIENLDIPFVRADAHNICPIKETSFKKEYAARTIRPKIQRALVEFLTRFPKLKKMPENNLVKIKREKIYKSIEVDNSVVPVRWLSSGEDEAQNMLEAFIAQKLDGYADKRNNPNEKACSDLSPYLHFGQISAQEVALKVIESNALKVNKEAFLEELVIRKELADNYCFYNENYDKPEGFDSWAKLTLEEHKDDIKEFLYSKEEFEYAKTHDKLWNAAQVQMLKTGKMHGYLRMYWAKKILEWSKSYSEAFEIALYLNDKYELDGCDPNGYVGAAWSIGGVHDRAWAPREVFGKIRYMNFNGCKSKFDVEKYISDVEML